MPNRQSAWFKNVLTAPDQLRQRMAYALSQILVISDISLGDDSRTEPVAAYYDILGNGAFGNFRTLLEQVTLSPMMGEYLSSLRNSKATFDNTGATLTTPDELLAVLAEYFDLHFPPGTRFGPPGRRTAEISMDPLIVILEAFLWVVDAVFTSADIYSWFRGRPNRIERKQARSSGEPIPPRDSWNQRVLLFSVIVLALTVFLLAWRFVCRAPSVRYRPRLLMSPHSRFTPALLLAVAALTGATASAQAVRT
eukprot:gene15695-20789_t